ncbi:hypothetical protein [Gordonia malaquae]|uniref:hypothetical protein n=1 Tax=Gordonia malaquae TaxID=410332 RepID=UPI0030196BC1
MSDNKIVNMDPDALRAAGGEFKAVAEEVLTYEADLKAAIATVREAATVGSHVMPVVENVLVRLEGGVKITLEEVGVIAGNVTKVADALIKQANGTQDIDQSTAKKVTDV